MDSMDKLRLLLQMRHSQLALYWLGNLTMMIEFWQRGQALSGGQYGMAHSRLCWSPVGFVCGGFGHLEAAGFPNADSRCLLVVARCSLFRPRF